MNESINMRPKLGLLAAFLLVLSPIIFLLAQPAYAASTWTVSNLNDSGTGSLRDAINRAASEDSIIFQSGLTGTIVLSSQLTIDKILTITGPGPDRITVSGNNQCRVFKVMGNNSLITVSISGLTVANGKAVGENGHYGYDGQGGVGGGGGGASGGGGGLSITGGTVTISNVTFANNCAIGGDGGHGGEGWETSGGYGYGGGGGSSDLGIDSLGGAGGTSTQMGGEDGNMYSGGGGGCGGWTNSSGYSGGRGYYFGGDGGFGGNHGGQEFFYGMAGYGGDGGQGGSGLGGAVCLTNGSLTISNSTFNGNMAIGGRGGNAGDTWFSLSGQEGRYFGGHGGDGGAGKGGAIYIGSTESNCKTEPVWLVNCSFTDNGTAGGAGGLVPSGGPAFENGYDGGYDSAGAGIYNRNLVYQRNLAGNSNSITGGGGEVVLDGPDAGSSTVTASLESVPVGSTATITVALKNVHGQPVFGESVILSGTVIWGSNGENAKISPASVVTDKNGIAIFTVTNTNADMVTYTALASNSNITVTEAPTINYEAGIPDAGTSTLTASARFVPITTDFWDRHLVAITVDPKDAYGNSLGDTADISAVNGNSVNAGSGTDENNRLYYWFYNESAETITYSATVSYWAIDGNGNWREKFITLNQTATITYGLFGDIGGRVTEGPTPVEGATVSLTVNETTYSDTTGADGKYTLSVVPADSGYTVTARKGDNSASISNITVANGATTSEVNINIKPWLLFVTFNNGGELSYALLSDDGKVQLPADPLRTGYQFSGWYTGLHGTGTQLTVDTIMDTNTTFYAYWRITAANASGSNFVFTCDASSPWTAEIGGYADQYAVSGPIPDTGSTSIYTTISGPGYLSFDWYPGFSPQQFSLYVDDICITSFIYAGGLLWENYGCNIDEGSHTIRWTLSGSPGGYGGYLKSVALQNGEPSGSISGSVTDGVAPLDGVTVKVSVNGEEYSATTDSNGSYTISGVPAGSGYTLIASKDGYNSNNIENVNVTAGANTPNMNLTLTKTEVEGCFIATAAFGSKFDWPVALLREFRDQYLLTNTLGKTFVNFYYQNSPPIAVVIASSEPLKITVRILLAPVIAIVYLIYHPIMLATLLALLITLFGYRFKMRRRYI
jgi:uncharacterized repeat protein (TIGR02543 family)